MRLSRLLPLVLAVLACALPTPTRAAPRATAPAAPAPLPGAPLPPDLPPPDLAPPAAHPPSDAPSAAGQVDGTRVRLLPAGTVRPFKGGLVPEGAHLEERGEPSLVLAGLVIGGASYAALLLVGLVTLFVDPALGLLSLIPIVGLFPWMGVPGVALLALLDLVGQVGGLGLALYGQFGKSKVLVYDREGPEPGFRAPAFSLAPALNGGPGVRDAF